MGSQTQKDKHLAGKNSLIVGVVSVIFLQAKSPIVFEIFSQ